MEDEITSDPIAKRSLAFLQELFAGYHPRNFAVRLWEGTVWEPEPGQSVCFSLIFQHPGALRRMFWRATELSVTEAYLYNDLDIEGDITSVLAFADHLLAKRATILDQLRRAQVLLGLPTDAQPRFRRRGAALQGKLHSKERDRKAISYHYDVSNDFFALWLDQKMVYSCAYFRSHDDSLDDAQEQKLEYICRKLQLRAGQRLLDIGCGWGGLLIAAGHRGVDALGITLSQAQADLANERIARAGLADRCRAKVLDYRDLDQTDHFDRLVSVGMFEHVGQKMLLEYFRRAWILLRPGGLFLNHGIAYSFPQPRSVRPTFFDSYVFPDGELFPLSTTLRAAESSGFEVRDVESLREHYVLTIRKWLARLENNFDNVRGIADEITYRIWRLYLAAAVHQFITGRATIFQTLLSKQNNGATELPLTRLEW